MIRLPLRLLILASFVTLFACGHPVVIPDSGGDASDAIAADTIHAVDAHDAPACVGEQQECGVDASTPRPVARTAAAAGDRRRRELQTGFWFTFTNLSACDR